MRLVDAVCVGDSSIRHYRGNTNSRIEVRKNGKAVRELNNPNHVIDNYMDHIRSLPSPRRIKLASAVTSPVKVRRVEYYPLSPQREKIFRDNLHRAEKLAGYGMRSRIPGLDYDDMRSLAMESLLFAVRKWDVEGKAAVPSLMTNLFRLMLRRKARQSGYSVKCSCSFESTIFGDDESAVLADIVKSMDHIRMEDSLSFDVLIKNLESRLRPSDMEAIHMLLDGHSFSHIIKHMGHRSVNMITVIKNRIVNALKDIYVSDPPVSFN